MILVTGGTGMVGGDIVRMLSQQGVAARAMTRNPQKVPNLPGITWVTGDLAKPDIARRIRGRGHVIPCFEYWRRHGGAAAQRHRGSTGRRDHAYREAVGIRRHGPLVSADLPLALSDRAGDAGIGNGLDHSSTSPFHAEPADPDPIHHQRRRGLFGFGRRFDPLHRCPRHRRGRRRHTYSTWTSGPDIRGYRQRGAVLPSGNRNHQQYDWQAAPLY
ncbi:NAD(P)H-binding protein [Bradyrhizobium diazoefficiens]|nr:NAD(P)H-binding protein [Bradyrhizobium diazoefficiens]MBR0885454.1 NAD(P)H-binding protein [Bradyrhizobium diazoefficiens]MBR0917347.1 NAD(P)H-binding protein [Bradyrhizobium diazoefficiens]